MLQKYSYAGKIQSGKRTERETQPCERFVIQHLINAWFLFGS